MKRPSFRALIQHLLPYSGVIFLVLICVTLAAIDPALAQNARPTSLPSGGWNIGTYFIEGIVSIIAFTLMTIFSWLSQLFLGIIDGLILPGQNSLLYSSEIQDAWQIMLNITNLVFFVALLAFSVMIITRSGGYNLKKALTSMVVTVVFANLSYRIVLVLVEAGDALRNMTSNLLGVNAEVWTQHTQQLTQLNASVLGTTSGNILKYIAVAALLLAMSALIMFMLFRLAFVLIERAIWLAVLTIIGPLQIALGMVPQKDIQSKAGNWIVQVARWVLVLPATFLMMALAIKILPTNAVETLLSFVVTSFDDTVGAGGDQLTGTGVIMYFIVSIGLMYIATQVPTMLAPSLSPATKTITDGFANQWLLGGLGKQVTGIIAHGSRLAGSWATESKLLNYKIGKREFGVNAIRRRLATNRLRLDEAKEQVARVSRDEGNKGFAGAYQRGQGTRLRDTYQKLLAEDPKYLKLQQEETDAKNSGDFNLAKKKRQEMFSLEKTLASNASGTVEKLGPGARKKYDIIFRQIAHQEATNTTRSNLDFKLAMAGWIKKLADQKGRLNDGDMKNFMEDVGGGWERANSVGPATERAEMAQHIKDLIKEKGADKVIGMFRNMARDDWPGATLEDVLDAKIKAGQRKDVDTTSGDMENEDDTGSADRPIQGFIKAAKQAEQIKANISSLSNQVSGTNRSIGVGELDNRIGTAIAETLKVPREQHQSIQQLSGDGAKLLETAFFSDQKSDENQALASVLGKLRSDSPLISQLIEGVAALRNSGDDKSKGNRLEDLTRLLTAIGAGTGAESLAKKFGDGELDFKANDAAGIAAFAANYDNSPVNTDTYTRPIQQMLTDLQDKAAKVQITTETEQLAQAQERQTTAQTATATNIESDRITEAVQNLGVDIQTALTGTHQDAMQLLQSFAARNQENRPLSQIAVASPADNSRIEGLLDRLVNLAQQTKTNPTGSANLNMTSADLKKALSQMALPDIITNFTAPGANAVQKLQNNPPR